MTNISSPIKTEPHHLIQQMQAVTPQSPKTVSKIIKVEEHVKSSLVQQVGDIDESEMNEMNALLGVDLAAEKKSLLAPTKMTNLDQIRACKDEKFLNIMILHKKFVDIG